jgi:hypothetical protein
MSQEKYIGMDVHDATISAAVKNAEGKLLMECVLETNLRDALIWNQSVIDQVLGNKINGRSPAPLPEDSAGGRGWRFAVHSWFVRLENHRSLAFNFFLLSLP